MTSAVHFSDGVYMIYRIKWVSIALSAVRLSRELKTEAEYWINLQKEYDIDIARKTLAGIIPEDQPIEKVLVNNPHDKLIKIVFSDRTEAEAYFKQNLPPKTGRAD